ncbi:MAG: tail fiber domain-containing protein [Bdellovibrionales bacterium]|nr:tail fiber domain-containing protein [Bdellovibrionales bacterium]
MKTVTRRVSSRLNSVLVFPLVFAIGIGPAFAPRSAFGAVSPNFVYQGVFTDTGTGLPITNIVDLRLGIYNPAGTCLLYEEEHLAVNLGTTNGSFSLKLGSGTQTAASLARGYNMVQVFSNGQVTGACGYTPGASDARILKVEIQNPTGSSYVALSPDQAIESVPTAVIAQTLQGYVPSDFMQSSGASNVTNTNIANGAVDSAKIQDGSVALADLAGNSVDSSKIVDGTIVQTDLAANSVGATNIIDGSIGLSKMDGNICANGEILKKVGGAGGTWACATDATGGGGGLSSFTEVGTTPLTIGGTLTDPTLTIAQVSGVSDGYATAADFLAWNAKVGSVSAGDASVTVGGTATAPTVAVATNGVTTTKINDGAVTLAKISPVGCADGEIIKRAGGVWTCAADATGGGGGLSSFTEVGTTPLTIGGTLTDPTLTISQVSGVSDGYATSADFLAWNAKVASVSAADATITVGGTATAPTVALANNAVNLSKLDTAICSNGEILKKSGGVWTCAADATGGSPTLNNGRIWVGVGTTPTELAGGATDDVLKWNGSAWVAGAITGGTMTGATLTNGTVNGSTVISTSGTITTTNTITGGNLATGGNLTFSGAGSNISNSAGNVQVNDNLDVTGNLTVAGGGITTTANTNLTLSGAGTGTIVLNDATAINGNTTVTGTLTATTLGGATVINTTGNITTTGTITGGALNGTSLSISGGGPISTTGNISGGAITGTSLTSSGTVSGAGLIATPVGAAPGDTGSVELMELAVNGTNVVRFKAPDLLAADVNLVWPDNDGASAGQVLTTDGNGVLSWTTPSTSVGVSGINNLNQFAAALCPANQVLKVNATGTAWICDSDQTGGGGTGDIDAVTAGSGLTGGGTAGPVSLAVDFGVVSGKVPRVGAGGITNSRFCKSDASGDIVCTQNTMATADITNSAITYAKIQNVSTNNRILGRNTAGAGVIEELTPAQATAMLSQFAGSTAGTVPTSAGGTTNFLRADGTWSAPPAGITNAAGANILTKSNGTNLVASTVSDDGTTVAINPSTTINLQTGGTTRLAATASGAAVTGALSASTSITSGTNGGTGGSLVMNGATSGAVTLNVPATVTSYSYTWPNAAPGTPASMFLRGDGTWATPSGAGDITDVTAAATSGLAVTNSSGPAPDIALKNVAALTDQSVMKWDNTNDQFVNTALTESAGMLTSSAAIGLTAAAGSAVTISSSGAGATTVAAGSSGMALNSAGTTATAINLNVTGVNGGITLGANGTGVVTVAGTTPTVTSAGNLVAQSASGSTTTLGNNGGASVTTIRSGTGILSLNSANTGATAINLAVSGVNGGITLGANGTGVVTVGGTTPTVTSAGNLVAQSASGSTTTIGNNGGASVTTIRSGTGILSLNSANTGATAINLNVTGVNGGITLGANGTGTVIVGGTTPTVTSAGALVLQSASGSATTIGSTGGAASTAIQSGTGALTLVNNGWTYTWPNAAPGTPASMFLRGDGTWAAPAGGGDITDVTATANGGLVVNNATGPAPDVGLKNVAALTDQSVMKWDNTNDQFVNTSLTETAGVLTSSAGVGMTAAAGSNANLTASGAGSTTVASGTGGVSITSTGTTATAINIATSGASGGVTLTAGANGGITLGANGTGVVTVGGTTPTITSAGAMLVQSVSGGTSTFGNNGGASITNLRSGTGGVSITSSATPANAINLAVTGAGGGVTLTAGANGGITLGANGTGVVTVGGTTPTITSAGNFVAQSASGSTTTIGNNGGASLTTVRSGTGVLSLQSASLANNAIDLTVSGTNGGISLNPNGTGGVSIGGSSPIIWSASGLTLQNTTGTMVVGTNAGATSTAIRSGTGSLTFSNNGWTYTWPNAAPGTPTSMFLRGDGTWAAPAGGGDITDVTATANGGLVVNNATGPAPDVGLKNVAALTDQSVMKWDNTNDQFVNTSLTESAGMLTSSAAIGLTAAAGSAVTISSSGAGATTVAAGTGAMALNSAGTTASAINLNVTGVNGGITLGANGTGIVTVGGTTPTVSSASSMIFGGNTAATTTTIRSGTGGITLAPTTTGVVSIGGTTPQITSAGALIVQSASGGASTFGSNGGAASTVLRAGTGGLSITNNGNTFTWPTTATGGTTNFLRADGTWSAPSGSGTTTNAVTFNNGGAGAASGTTFDGSAARTISYNSIGAVGGSGTTNTVPRFASANTLADSGITDNGTTIGLARNTSVTGVLTTTDSIQLGTASNRGLSIIENYMSLGESEGGATTILGNNIRVTDGVGSTVQVSANALDGSNWLGINYSRGFTFNRVGPTAVGTQIAETTGELVRITTAGNVGIGTPSPSGRLSVKAAGAGWRDQLVLESSSSAADWNILVDSGASNQLRFAYNGGAVEAMRFTTAGAVTFPFTVTSVGNVTAPGYYHSSDIRLKEHVVTYDHALDTVKALRGVRFDWKKDGTSEIGFIAQEVEAVDPVLVKTGDDPEKIKSVKYANITAILVEAFKELVGREDSRYAELQAKNAELQKRLDALEAKIDAQSNRAPASK